jgi:catechol-2,3-dioxygenase
MRARDHTEHCPQRLNEPLGNARSTATRIVGTADHGFTHSLYVLDPDGNEIELYIDVAGVDWNDMSIMARPTRPLRL